MIYVHNRNKCKLCHNQYVLHNKGLNQANRNNSDQIWSLFGNCQQNDSKIFPVCIYCQSKQQTQNQTQRFIRSTNQSLKKNIENENTIQNQQNNSKNQKDKKNNKNNKNIPENINKNIPENVDKNDRKQKKMNENDNQSGQIPLSHRQPINQKSLQKYLNSMKPYSRMMPNSAFSKFYNRPCQQVYGRKNTTQTGVLYGNYMKTHSIQPHSGTNKPQKYQSYRSALNFGKRTKLDIQDKWRRIQRQLASKMNKQINKQQQYEGQYKINQNNVKNILKENNYNIQGQKWIKKQKSKSLEKIINKKQSYIEEKNQIKLRQNNQIKRSKSMGKRQPYYIYSYQTKDGTKKYARDRHGITCYVDPAFNENDNAYTKFQCRINPIINDDIVDEDDRNLDRIRQHNALQGKQKSYPIHYLTPNVQIPYDPKNYTMKSHKSNKQSTMASFKLKNNNLNDIIIEN